MPTAALGLLALAHVFDYTTFLVMTSRHGLAAELNPVVIAVAQAFGVPGLTVAKTASVLVLALATIMLWRLHHNRVAASLLALGIFAGILGGVSNLATI